MTNPDDKKVDDLDESLGEFDPPATDEQPRKTCSLDDGPCESCQ